MNNNQPNLLTKEGLEKLNKEYRELKENKRPITVERLALARGQGDLSENSEYESAREELSFIDDRLYELENILKNSKAVQKKPGNSQTVEVGSQVTVSKDGETISYSIVSEFESDPRLRKISYKSPIGQALMNKAKGDIITIKIPDGEFKYQIISIE